MKKCFLKKVHKFKKYTLCNNEWNKKENFVNHEMWMKKLRREQDLNLRGETPLDF